MANDPTLKKPMSDRESLKAKLRALLAKTTANGCTEPEAASAMARAMRIMEAYGIDADDLETVEGAPSWNARSRECAPYSYVWGAIRWVSNCQSKWRWRRTETGREHYAEVYSGRSHDVALAEYLRALCDRAIRRAQADFRKSKTWRLKRSQKTRDLEMAAFTEGLCMRLAGAVHRTFAHRRIATEPVETAVAEQPEPTKAEKEREKRRFRSWRRMTRRSGFLAGIAAASGIQVADAMAGGEAPAPMMIGRP